ncbi:MAG: LysM peptidoglycan-binding domain-containing protein [Aureispira sp.]|nr:LysM peptidoglycan-binding domain-containing protein [Aureispira sp.]
MQNKVLWLMGLLFPLTAFSQKTVTPKAYIAKYKDIAIKEMERSGIPASITLAQGIHESAYGTSTLAREAKNHFGIKCTKDWGGETYKKWDDEAKKSCFRVYSSAEQSYIDHTDFLVNRKHYAFLFDYPTTDYKSWAKGLRKAGYATDPKYPTKLIHTIELYKLSQYDKVNSGGLVVFEPKATPDLPKNTSIYTQPKPIERKLRTKRASFLFKRYKKGIFRHNGASFVMAQDGESPLDASIRFGIPYNKLLKFNDLVDGDVLLKNQYVYISPKRSSFKGQKDFHKVENDERMYEIAQLYGMKLQALLEKNLMVEGQEPKNGEIIRLKEKALARPAMRSISHIDKLPDDGTNNNNNTYKPVVSSVTIKRPKAEDVKLNTPVYEDNIYTKKPTLNTTVNKDSIAFGKKDIKIDNDTSWMIEEDVDTSYFNNTTNTGALYTPKTTYTPNENTNVSVDSPKVNKAALFPAGIGGTGTTTTNTNPVPKTTTNNNVEDNGVSTNKTGFVMHEVQPQETLYRLSVKYKVSVDEIKSVNNLSNNTITPKQQLKIPQK